MSVTIKLGSVSRVSKLYSFRNSPDCPWTLEETVKHWFDMTLERDGLTAKGARASVRVEKSSVVLEISGPDSIAGALEEYGTRLPQFLTNGWNALTKSIPKVKKAKLWDPDPDPQPPEYHPWRFFMPHGMAMLKQRALLFFHYPPIRLLDTNQDYLDDPVPVRCEELLTANGAEHSDLPLFNTVMDATPIGAEDAQGSKKSTKGQKDWGLIPINYFQDYQKSQVKLLLNPSEKKGYTVPIVVYGSHPREIFKLNYKTKLSNNGVTIVEDIIKGMKTPVMASTHPYVFYGFAQGFDKIGSGKIVDRKRGTAQMIKDLIVARWLKLMADDPSQDPKLVLKHCQAFWNDDAQSGVVADLVDHQGSLFYSNPTTLTFQYLTPLPTFAQVTAKEAVPPKAAEKKTAKKKSAKKKTTRKTKPKPKPSTVNVTTVIGDQGKPVDWWFIYKISETAKTTARRAVTGAEYIYYDSTMADDSDSGVVLSPHRIDQSSALQHTLAPIFSDAAKANKQLGWYCYNDEDHYDHRHSGSGPSDRGHCKGTVAFDLETDTAFWLLHSVPLFPLKYEFDYPEGGLRMAQTMLCIQLQDATTAMQIARLMYDAHGPNVHLASDLLKKTSKQRNGYKASSLPLTEVPELLDPNDPRILLMQNKNGSTGRKPSPYSGRIPFKSRGGKKFLAIAKNKAWGNKEDDPHGAKDFYNDLVAPLLNEDLEVETWEHAGTKIPEDFEPGDQHSVEDMKGVDLNKIGIPYSWSESFDHAKLALSDHDNPAGTPRWVCVGDINYTLAQERRGGGTVAFQCEPLWNSLEKALTPTKPSKKKKATRKKAAKKKSRKK